MDLNELLHAHQVEVMKAGASGDESHFDMIAEYADRKRQLRTIPQGVPIPADPTAPPTIIYGSYAGSWVAEPGASSSQQGSEGSIREASETRTAGAQAIKLRS
jgi:hypothetical protein